MNEWIINFNKDLKKENQTQIQYLKDSDFLELNSFDFDKDEMIHQNHILISLAGEHKDLFYSIIIKKILIKLNKYDFQILKKINDSFLPNQITTFDNQKEIIKNWNININDFYNILFSY